MFPLLIAALISGGLAVYTWQHRRTAGAVPFAVMMFVLFEWGLAYIMELAGTTMEAKIFWELIKFIGVVATPVVWLVFAAEYTGRKTWINTQRLILLSIVPIATLIILLTNSSHLLFRKSYAITFENGFYLLEAIGGPWFWVNAAATWRIPSPVSAIPAWPSIRPSWI